MQGEVMHHLAYYVFLLMQLKARYKLTNIAASAPIFHLSELSKYIMNSGCLIRGLQLMFTLLPLVM